MNNIDFLVILYEDERIDIYFDISEAYTKKLVYGEEEKKELYIIFQDESLLRNLNNNFYSSLQDLSLGTILEAFGSNPFPLIV